MVGLLNVGFNGFLIFLFFKFSMFGGRNNFNRILKLFIDESIFVYIENYVMLLLIKDF